tara:strand:- start:459 stop:830 length:372 start_codon:yes stop_codon:yes gene_type:complete
MIKEIFTWWNGQTFGTRLWSYFHGQEVGRDEKNNRYFKNKSDTKRWVIYDGEIDSSMTNPDWNNWLRYTSKEIPREAKKHFWQKNHIPNQTGTQNAYMPKRDQESSITKKQKSLGYEKWKPKN